MNINLYDALKSSYNDKKAKQQLSNAGFKYDSMLSNHNQQVWYNPSDKKLLFNVTGTHNLSDWGTDAWLAAGHIKDTNRYKEAKNTLNQAKTKYNVNNATVTGHSLGGTIAGYISSKDDNVYTLDKGATIGQKVRGNEHAYRTSGDIVSLLDSGATRMKTLQNTGIRTGILPLDVYNAHNVDNIRNQKINV
jgi:hypothetical protein